MKMKKACEATFLTERAIRLYISKGLIAPRQVNGLIDFSPEDVQLLRDIALLRQMDFSVEQIAGMISGKEIPAILAARREAALSGAERESAVAAALSGLEAATLTDVHALADGIRARRVSPVLNFAQLDEMDEDVRRQEAAEASQAVDRQQKRQRLLNRLLAAGGVLLAVMVIAAVYLSRPRVIGHIAMSPVKVLSVQGERATFRTENGEAIELLGRDVITVPYRADGFAPGITLAPRIAAGDVAEHACQLSVELTNYDLLRLGINPLQELEPRSVQRHNGWMTLILRAMFEDGESSNATLWMRYPAGTRPLLWVEE